MPVPQIMAAVGMQALDALQRVVAGNLANASTPGFKKMLVSFRETGGVPTPVGAVDLRQGPLEKTDNPLDFALDGLGFFVAEGDRLYRGGAFVVDRAGCLATRDGFELQGDHGPIRVGRSFSIDIDGTVHSDGVVAGRLRVVEASNLVREGGWLRGDGLRASSAQVRTGFIEGANVGAVDEMVHMMQTLRSFELLQQVVRADDEMQQRTTTDVGRVR